jgi:hypothetical protein
MWGPHCAVTNSQATSATGLTPAIVACFVFWREIGHQAFADFPFATDE